MSKATDNIQLGSWNAKRICNVINITIYHGLLDEELWVLIVNVPRSDEKE